MRLLYVFLTGLIIVIISGLSIHRPNPITDFGFILGLLALFYVLVRALGGIKNSSSRSNLTPKSKKEGNLTTQSAELRSKIYFWQA